MKKSLVKLAALSSAAFVLAGGIAPVVTTYAQSETSIVDNSIKSAEAKVAEAKAAKEASEAKVNELGESFNTLKAACPNFVPDSTKVVCGSGFSKKSSFKDDELNA